MRRLPFLLALFVLAVPASWASGHAHSATSMRARTPSPPVGIRMHAPSVFPRANLVESEGANTRTTHESTFAAFVVRTLFGFSARSSH